MVILILSLIYIAFISLGLPDGLLGASWPVMHHEIDASLSLAGAVSLIITCGTIVSSLLSDRLTKRFGAGRVTAISVALTAAALFGFSFSSSFWMLCLCAVPYGLGAGAVDAALNNVVALHFSAKHMSWLHCFWGVGSSIGPYIMGLFLASPAGWRGGYQMVGLIQVCITALLFLSLPLWKTLGSSAQADTTQETTPIGIRNTLRLPGAKALFVAFFSYGAAEMIAMLWSSSYLTEYRQLDPDDAATFASLFYLGMMIGRFISGFVAERLGDKRMIRLGLLLAFPGVLLLALPVDSTALCVAGLLIIGLGCAPLYPSIIHSTPTNFGRQYSQAVIGMEMASAYAGSAIAPPLFGLVAEHVSAGFFPLFVAAGLAMTFVMTERLNRVVKSASQ